MFRKTLLRVSLVTALAVVSLIVLARTRPPAQCSLTALDVGQGDAILIQTPDGQDLLIDGGPGRDVTTAVSRYLRPGDRTIELVILTHPDADHLTGLVGLLEHLEVKSVFMGHATTTTTTWKNWLAALETKKITPRIVSRGEQYQLGSELHLNILWPPANEPQSATNELSVGMRVTCLQSTAIMIGDASAEVEERIVATGQDITSTLLKVGHHGSKFSSPHAFLRAVDPAIAVISVGRDNRYGHPHPSVLLRLTKAGVTVYRTDLLGDVRMYTDGRGGWRLGG